VPEGRSAHRLPVRFDEAVWRDAIRGFSGEALQSALNARAELERSGVALATLLPCDAQGVDKTELAGCAKLYLPLGDRPPSERTFAFVLQLVRDIEGKLAWDFVAFGRRHSGPGVRSVYHRSHRQLHGRFPQ